MKKKEEADFDLFHITFIGEFVEILTPIYRKHIQGDESGVSDETIPIVLQGYILDIDDTYLYVGDTPEAITQAVFKNDARIIRIVKEQNPYDDMLDQMEMPNKREDVN